MAKAARAPTAIRLNIMRRGGHKNIGGADGIRTHDLLDAIEARSQLRHGPTERSKFITITRAEAARRFTGTLFFTL